VLENEMRAAAAVEPIDNRLFVLVLQHPQEKREVQATAAAACAALRRAALVVGLSWPNLVRALGGPADARQWAVLYLGSARPAALGLEREIIVLDRAGMPMADQDGMLRGLEGVVLLDGSWSEAKTLWWRNPWLLRLRRLVLNPPHRSRFGRVRREPRHEALSTLEAAALLLRHLDAGPAVEAALLDRLDRLIAEARTAGRAQARKVVRSNL
jgi:DTW domain-containing protein